MDDELERLKQKRLMEMQRQMLLKQIKSQEPKQEPAKEPTPDEILGKHFGDRAWEVWNAAKAQYPQVMPQVEKLLVDAINQGTV
jgi:DNA-binding TFAR19-related protein (PDSD5 family)